MAFNPFSSDPVVPVLRLDGVIAPKARFGSGLNIAALAEPIQKLFKHKKAPAVALIINSPGGSPVQSRLIHDRIRQLAEENDTRVLAFCEDAAASGGYFLACAADEIYCDDSSILGSIGVISAMFGFHEAIAKLGVERRVITAGANKSVLDPFQPLREADVERLKAIQLAIHASFKEVVRRSRGERLRGLTAPQAEGGAPEPAPTGFGAPDPWAQHGAPGTGQPEEVERLFDGSFWDGRRAVELGLADGIGDVRAVCRAKFGDKVKLKLIPTEKKSFFAKLLGARLGGALSDQWADQAAQAALARLDAETLWGGLGR